MLSVARRPLFLSLGPATALPAVAIGSLVCAAVAGLAAAHSPKYAVVAALGAVVAVVMLRSLLAATLLFVFVTFPANLPSSLGAGATLAKPLGMLLAVAWALSFLRDRSQPVLFREHPLLGGLLVAYVGWATISIVWSADRSNTVYDLQRLLQATLLMVVVFTVARTRRELLILARGYVVASAFWSIYALGSGATVESTRLTGGISDPNYLAAQLALGVIAGLYLLVGSHRLWLRLLLLAAVAADVTAFVRTESRGGILGLGLGTLAAVVVAGRMRPRVLMVIAAVAGVAFGYYTIIAPAAVRNRVTNYSSQASSGRSDSWQIALRIARDHPAIGVGLGGYQQEQVSYVASGINLQHPLYVLRDRLVVHNTYLETLAELGMVGIVFFLATIATAFGTARAAVRRAEAAGRSEIAASGRALFAGGTALLGGYVFVSAEYQKSLWIVLALLAATSGVLRRTTPA